MASLNLSTNGPSIQKAYTNVVNGSLPSGAAGSSPSYGQWAVYSVSAPLVNAFQPDSGNKESVLKVQSTGEGELVDLEEEFVDGRVQFAFVKVKDPNSGLPKSILIAWCGQGVPERVKGYFTNHLNTVSKTLHGYHVQITARSETDISPDLILQKVADASGSKYAGAPQASSAPPPKPTTSSKAAFLPTQHSGVGSERVALPGMGRPQATDTQPVDEDGWGADAPQITRRQLEKVPSAYQPTKPTFGGSSASISTPDNAAASPSRDGIIGGGYQPVGKVDIADIRRRAQQGGQQQDDRPSIVKGSYEPVGKVDIAAIRAKSKGGDQLEKPAAPTPSPGPAASFPDGGAERMTSLPKPKVTKAFGQQASFSGTRAPQPSEFGIKSPGAVPPTVGSASRTFAESGGKTPAQLWAEKKAKAGGAVAAPAPSPSAPLSETTSGGGWTSGYSGKKWGPVETNRTGRSAVSADSREDDAQPPAADDDTPSRGGIGALRDQFQSTAIAAPPPVNVGSRPVPSATGSTTAGIAPPPQPPRSPSPPTPPIMHDTSPVRIAMPVGRGAGPLVEAPEDPDVAPVPIESLAKAASNEPEADAAEEDPDMGRAAAQHVPASNPSPAPAPAAAASSKASVGAKKQALVQYDYEAAENNEINLREGETITDLDMVDTDWWLGSNAEGQRGLFPANYVELHEGASGGDVGTAHASEPAREEAAPAEAHETPSAASGKTATALYDYEAAEDNELSFEEGAQITGVQFPDEDWWSGHYQGKEGLFPANYVQLDS